MQLETRLADLYLYINRDENVQVSTTKTHKMQMMQEASIEHETKTSRRQVQTKFKQKAVNLKANKNPEWYSTQKAILYALPADLSECS